MFTLLVCTVGGSADALLGSLLKWRPSRVLFVPSPQTCTQVETILQSYRERADKPLDPGQYCVHQVRDAEDLAECLAVLRGLDAEVRCWRERGGDYQVVADFTGGTKCMSAALALQARRWPARFSYVGGRRRTKDGIGTVETGSERIVHWENPWNALGYQAIEDACLLFDRHAFASAAKLLEQTRNAADDGAVKRTLSTFHQLCDGYAKWDIFQHKDARSQIDNVLRNAIDIEVVLGAERYRIVKNTVDSNRKFVDGIGGKRPSRAVVSDLLANARRRSDEGRYDDGVARVYRAIEAIAQIALEARGFSHNEGVSIEGLPNTLRERWEARAESGRVLLGLQDSYELLDALGDKTGQSFRQANLHGMQSPLTARNRSILAHGFEPVGSPIFESLWTAAMKLGNFSDDDLPKFPRLT